ncbi:MAG: helix-turn-helix domain-containing protein [Oligoflexales bacterium]|nr:helix-turn-helix domain-containing protein [Oligoflexales bacterium]
MQNDQIRILALELGEQLKKTRMSAGLSIEAVSQKTRINLPILNAIESGNYEIWPEPAFIRGFIENVCRECAASPLPILDLLKQFQNACAPASDSALMKKISTSRKSEAIRTYFKSFLSLKSASWLVLGVFIIAGASTYFSSQNKLDTREKQAQVLEKPRKAVNAKNVAKVKDSQKIVTKIDGSTELKNSEAIQSSKEPQAALLAFSQLDIKVKKAVKITQTCDGQAAQQSDFLPGSYSIKFNKICELLIDDASQVEINFNKNPLGTLATYKQKRRLQFRHEDQKL